MDKQRRRREKQSVRPKFFRIAAHIQMYVVIVHLYSDQEGDKDRVTDLKLQ